MERKLEKQPVRKGASGTLGSIMGVEKLVVRARVMGISIEERLVGIKGSTV